MSRPGSAAHSIASFQAEDKSHRGPSMSPAEDFYAQQHQGESFRPGSSSSGWEMRQGGHVNGMPEGRLVYPMPGHPTGIVTVNGSSGMPRHLPLSPDDDGDFLPIEENYYNQTTPYHPNPAYQQHAHHPHSHPHMYPGLVPYHPGQAPPHTISPTAMMGQHGRPMLHPEAYHTTPLPQHNYYAVPPRRPGMPARHSTIAVQRAPPLQRQYSLQPPPSRAVDTTGQDVFAIPPNDTPIRRPMSADYPHEEQFFNLPQGISPARALGPAPSAHFSPPIDPLITPQTKQITKAPSSAISTAMTASSTNESNFSPAENNEDDDNYSPTKPPKVKLEDTTYDPPARRPIMAPVRLKTVIGGRTSAKFAKVAEDPGVEGVPPGPRPTERPTPSFACIIGQAILRCSAGGLSLEHIYRYVETAYPYFKSGDGAWRNSVRHNLSIHKMFETIPRTEHYPPGKGGIWIIHDEEKIHWPSEDKFIKNFPTSHPHHAVCRQTCHERQKEQEAIAKARAEGREYVPKKGKKGRKAEECTPEVIQSLLEGSGPSHPYMVQHPRPHSVHPRPMPMPVAMPIPLPMQQIPESESESTTPKMAPKILHPPPFFRPLDEESVGMVEDSLPKGTMVPPRFGKRPIEGDEENVFSAPKRVRVAEPMPLMPIQQESVDDAYVTPERERMNKAMLMGSAFKTPGLVNSASSPGSSPMPPTVLRTTHHPSGLQQTWTQADVMPSSSPPFSLDAAFDIKPKQHYLRSTEDEFVQPSSSSTYTQPPPKSPRAPPKTPLTRSSAAADRTPRLNLHRTPFLAKTPMMHAATPTLNHAMLEISTPAWEMAGILDRLGNYPSAPPTIGAGAMRMQIFTPLRSPSRASSSNPSGSLPLGLRSPLTSTDPGRHALSGGSQAGTPTKGTFAEGEIEGTPTTSPSIKHLVNPVGSPSKNKISAAAAMIGRAMRVERERTRSGEMKAGV